MCAGGSEEIHAAAADFFDQPNTRFHARQDALTVLERLIAEVAPVKTEHIERHEVRPFATEQQVIEMAAAVRLQADDLAVWSSLAALGRVRQLVAQVRPGFVHVAASGDEPAAMARDVCELTTRRYKDRQDENEQRENFVECIRQRFAIAKQRIFARPKVS